MRREINPHRHFPRRKKAPGSADPPQTDFRHGLIVLIGFMGSGKSAVGWELARLLRCRFLDLDSEIERVAGCSIESIFRHEGEPAFRELESRVLRAAVRELAEGGVLATGGGIVTRRPNMRLLRERCRSVWLDAPFEVCYKRARSARRPLLRLGALGMRRLFEARRPAYASAEIRVRSHIGSSTQVATRIVRRLTPERASIRP